MTQIVTIPLVCKSRSTRDLLLLELTDLEDDLNRTSRRCSNCSYEDERNGTSSRSVTRQNLSRLEVPEVTFFAVSCLSQTDFIYDSFYCALCFDWSALFTNCFFSIGSILDCVSSPAVSFSYSQFIVSSFTPFSTDSKFHLVSDIFIITYF